MNLIEAANELEYVPTDQLTQMISDPNSRHPSFLVLSEVQRRNQMQRSYDAELAAQNKPNTTVSEEAIAELNGLAGMSSNQPLSSPSMGESPVGDDVPASGLSGMQMMKEGGRTGYANRGRTNSINKEIIAALGYDPLREKIRNLSTFDMDKFYSAIPEGLGQDAYNRELSNSINYPSGSGIRKLASARGTEAQEDARIKAIRDIAIKQGVPIGSIEDIYSLNPDEKGQRFSTFVPEGEDFSGGFEPPKINMENYQAGTGLTGTPIIFNQSSEEFDSPEMLQSELEIESQSNFDKARKQAESLYSGLNVPDLEKIKTDTSGLQSMLDNVPEFDRSKYKIDFDAPTPEDRAKDRQVRMLSGLAQVFGSAKNLGEAGTGIGALGQNIQDMRKEARKEDLDLAKQRISTEISIDALAKGDREERVLLNNTILQLKQADNVADQNRIIEMYKFSTEKTGKILQSTVDLIKNETQQNNIKRLSEQGRLDLYKEENDKLKDIATQLATSMGTQKDLLVRQYREQKAYVDRIAGVVRQDQYPEEDFSSIQTSENNDPLNLRK